MKRALWVLLLASLAANIYLWSTRPRADARDRGARAHDDVGHRRAPRLIDLAELARGDAPPQSRLDQLAQIDRATLEQRLLRVEASIEEHRPLKDQFARGARSPDLEARAKAVLDLVFVASSTEGSAGSAALPYAVECHGSVCKLESDVESIDWQMAIQQHPTRTTFGSMMFSYGRVFFTFASPDQVGQALVRGIYHAFGTSTQAQLCITGSPNAKGTLTISIQLDPLSRRSSGTIGGTLADQPVASCLRTVLDSICASTPVPPELTTVPQVEPLVIELPTE